MSQVKIHTRTAVPSATRAAMAVHTRRAGHGATERGAAPPAAGAALKGKLSRKATGTVPGPGPNADGIAVTGNAGVHHVHGLNTPKRVRVFVLTYFFSALTIDRWVVAGVHCGWIFSTLAEWFGMPVCHSNVQVNSRQRWSASAR